MLPEGKRADRMSDLLQKMKRSVQDDCIRRDPDGLLGLEEILQRERLQGYE